MWKPYKEEESYGAVPTGGGGADSSSAASMPPGRLALAECAHLGKSIHIKGEVTGSEDLHVEGQVEGSVDLRDRILVVGVNGRVRAKVTARNLVVQGSLQGNINCERLELKGTANVVSNIVTTKIVVEDGACLKGLVDVQHKEVPAGKHPMTPEIRHDSTAVAAAAPSSQAKPVPEHAYAQAGAGEQKK